MPKSKPTEVKETRCRQCQSRFRISKQQLEAARGIVKCGECGKIFNALKSLKDYADNLPVDIQSQSAGKASTTSRQNRELSLHEAMYGDRSSRVSQFAPLLWMIGILLLSTTGIAQAIYYQRYILIEKPQYQKQVLSLCQLVPCSESQFSSTQQIKMLERNVFTHPVQPSALMISGSFVNQAVFEQRLPDLLVSLFDIQGNLIANRLFTPTEYLQTDKNRRLMTNAKPVQFRLEISDPGTNALTYEFEFM